MFESAEIRWFFPGTAPTPVSTWFTGPPGLGTSQPARTDCYLLLPGCATVGVKAREGNFEVKALQRAPQPVSYAGRASGYCDQWIKWSKPLDGTALDALIAPGGDRWLLVRKHRLLRMISMDSGQPEEVDAARDHPGQGCQIELADIRALLTDEDEPAPGFDASKATRWWSLSLEAFGATERLARNLDRAAKAFFADPPPVRLTAEASMSYPAWIARLADPENPS